jgi:hypothetical protein
LIKTSFSKVETNILSLLVKHAYHVEYRFKMWQAA